MKDPGPSVRDRTTAELNAAMEAQVEDRECYIFIILCNRMHSLMGWLQSFLSGSRHHRVTTSTKFHDRMRTESRWYAPQADRTRLEKGSTQASEVRGDSACSAGTVVWCRCPGGSEMYLLR